MIQQKTLSDDAQHAIADMVELDMYLSAQSQQTPWFMAPRTTKRSQKPGMPFSSWVESSIAMELLDRTLIEPTSSRTFVISKSGREFYERELKPRVLLIAR
jgi:hypothetical protein